MKTQIVPFVLFLCIFQLSFGQKLIEEDFTTGDFDGYGSGVDGENWHLAGNGMGFWKTNNRSFDTALSHKVILGGGGWADRADWYVGSRDSIYYKVHKYNDITLVRMTTFSDHCYKNNFAGVEVAFLEYRSSLCPHPDYCHDQSWETLAAYYTVSGGKGGSACQLESNVENTDPLNYSSIDAYSWIHSGGWYSKSDLNVEQNSLVVWRNEPDIKKVNMEQWGNATSGEFWIDTHMVAKLDPANDYSKFSFIQITFFRGIPDEPTSDWFLRDGVDFSESQIGIKNLEVGITKRTDFNLDYTVDDEDATILNENWNATGTTIQTGDATNDGRTDYKDACQLIAFYNDSLHGDVEVSGVYNNTNGNITLDLQNISYFTISSEGAPILSGASVNTGAFSSEKYHESDTVFAAYTTGEWNQLINLGDVAQTGLNPAELTLTFNYKNSEQPHGFTVPLDGTVFTSTKEIQNTVTSSGISIHPNPATDKLHIEGLTGNEPFRIYSLLGNMVLSGTTSNTIDISSLGKSIYILHITGKNLKFVRK